MLGCVRSVIERMQRGEGMDPLLAVPYMMEIETYCLSILHSFSLLDGMIVGGDLSHGSESSHVVEPTRDSVRHGHRGRHRPTSKATLHVEVYIVPEHADPKLQRVQTPEPQPELMPKPHPDSPPICRIYTRRQKKTIGAPEPSSAL
ncbi:hypothetical protein H6P81_020035 [Aristolochia fimbriata]|uniref:Uncharacterized protein n=1 Tax=Aristolochia fimbriata TaxID=158543 RepID=A0AAV7DV72_ARIFI|nr:hypothetical protein H6P81_020035 [Aristolochia fimbriata]